MNLKQQKLDIYFREYDKLKAEQTQRIGFRDNILYVTLGLYSGILSFALSSSINYYVFIAIPWIGLILGWTYLVNDQKISAIGKYIRSRLTDNIKKQIDDIGNEPIFEWEIEHRSDERRKERKIKQLIIDELTFVISGIVALLIFCFSVSNPPYIIYLICALDLFLLIFLGYDIWILADLALGR